MPDTAALVRGSGASRRQIETWRVQGHLHATITHCRAEYDEVEIDVARALYRLGHLGIQPSGRLATDVADAIRTKKRTQLVVGPIRIYLTSLVKR